MTHFDFGSEGADAPSLLQVGNGSKPTWSHVILIEDNAGRAHRRVSVGVGSRQKRPNIVIRVHRIQKGKATVIAERRCRTRKRGKKSKRSGRVAATFALLDQLRLHRRGAIVVAGPRYGSDASFIGGLVERGFQFIAETRAGVTLRIHGTGRTRLTCPRKLLRHASWKKVDLAVPDAAGAIPYSVADLAAVTLPRDGVARLIAAQTGGIDGIHRGTIFAITSVLQTNLKHLLGALGWARWIRPSVRRQEKLALNTPARSPSDRVKKTSRTPGTKITVRSNISLAQRQDQAAFRNDQKSESLTWHSREVFAALRRINVVELFAGAGGMGLGFLLASRDSGRYRLTLSAEVDPVYVATLKHNHQTFRSLRKTRESLVPLKTEALDLRRSSTRKLVKERAREVGGIDLLIGGPPCQGFSNANRNSWHSGNPHNRMIAVFIRYVRALRPKAFLMENVQGILWTPRNADSPGHLNVADTLARRFRSAGYLIFPKLLDAVWYGVPQYRTRFFLLGLRSDLGYSADDFGAWGPFPKPTHGPGTGKDYITVREAIADLPPVGNGENRNVIPYTRGSKDRKSNEFLCAMRAGAPPQAISDHVTSRHADYVIKRYRQIPEGGNWEDIAGMLTNYTDVRRTHSNIYRRLAWNEPSVTIGHYRKSMLVHPDQHRGLSLREASRLQSFPDWFCFAGSRDGSNGGLMHKQQQLANAVCPLVTKAIAEFLLTL